MPNPRNVKKALGDRMRSIAGLTIYDRWPNSNGNLNVPCAIIQPGTLEPEQTFGRGDLTKQTYEVHVFVSAAGGIENGQDQIDKYLATSSTGGVFGAIATDRTLGGVVDATFVKALRDYAPIGDENQVVMQGCIVDVEVWST